MTQRVYAKKKLQEARKEIGMSRPEFASFISAATGYSVTSQAYTKYELGARGLDLKLATGIARILSQRTDKLFEIRGTKEYCL